MSAKGFFKTLAGLFGGFFLMAGVMFMFLGLVSMNLVKNVDTLDLILEEGLVEFLENNREEVRGYVIEQLEASGGVPQVDKPTLQAVCDNPSSIEDPDTRAMFTPEFCSTVPGLKESEAQDAFIDQMIDFNVANMLREGLPEGGAEEMKKAIQEYSVVFGNLIFVVLAGFMVVIFGAFLTFASVSFKWIRGLYRVCLKITVNLLTIGVLFIIFRYISPKSILGYMDKATNLIQGAQVENVPPLMLQLLASIVMKWLRLSTDPLIIVAFVAAIPFGVVTGILLAKRLKDQGEMKGKEEKKTAGKIPDEEVV